MKSAFDHVHHCLNIFYSNAAHIKLANFTKYSYNLCSIFYFNQFFLDYDYVYIPHIFLDYRLHQSTWTYVIDYNQLQLQITNAHV